MIITCSRLPLCSPSISAEWAHDPECALRRMCAHGALVSGYPLCNTDLSARLHAKLLGDPAPTCTAVVEHVCTETMPGGAQRRYVRILLDEPGLPIRVDQRVEIKVLP